MSTVDVNALAVGGTIYDAVNWLELGNGPTPGESGPNVRLVVSLAWKEPPSNPVIFEQVVERSRAMREAGFAARVVFGLLRTDVSLTRNFGADVALIAASSARSLRRLIHRIMATAGANGERKPVLICRGAFVTVAALAVRAVSGADWVIVHDARGWYALEGIEKRDGLATRKAKPLVERLAFTRSDHNVVVSEALLGIALSLGANPASTRVIPPYTRPLGRAARHKSTRTWCTWAILSARINRSVWSHRSFGPSRTLCRRPRLAGSIVRLRPSLRQSP
jgi:hypothetical protein